LLPGSESKVEATGEEDRTEEEDAGTSGADLEWEAPKEGAGTSGSRAAKLFLVCPGSTSPTTPSVFKYICKNVTVLEYGCNIYKSEYFPNALYVMFLS
jgi:hypothetical protein